MAASKTEPAPLSAPGAGVAVGLLAIAVYLPTLRFGFVWDDPISVQRWLPAIPGMLDAFFPPPDIPQFPVDYYRPLQLLSYRLDNAIGGGAAWPFHLTVVLLHTLATVLIWRTGFRLLDSDAAASRAGIWAAALFAVHPIHSESVAWMAARPDVMVTCAGLAALLAYWRTDWSERKRASIAAAFIFVGLLCKETAAALLVIVPLSTFIVPRTSSGPASAKSTFPSQVGWLPFVIALAAYLILRAVGSYAALPDAVLPSNPIAAVIGAAGTYLRLLVIPYPQNAYVADLSSSGAALLASAALVTAFVLLFAWILKRRDAAVLFSLVWIVLTLLPSFGLILQPSTAPLAERYLYLPSAGFCWIFGVIVARAHQTYARSGGATALTAVCALIVVGAGTLTVQRNWVWTDNYSLWSDTTAKNDVDGLPLRSLAAAVLEKGDSQTAERLFRQALERRNTTRGKYIIYNNLGTIALGRNDDVAAERYYRQAAEFEPAPALLYNLGLIRLRRGMDPALDSAVRDAALVDAKALFEKAVATSPHDAEIHLGLAQTAEALGDRVTARLHFEKALQLGLAHPMETTVRQRLEALDNQPPSTSPQPPTR